MAINRDKVLEAAQKYVDKKKYDKAVQELQRLIEADPNDARTALKIGDLQAKQGQHAAAIGTYERVGQLYAQQGFALKAIAVYKQIREIVVKHVPQLEERYAHITPKLAELYQQLGLTSDALAALDEVATRLQKQQKDAEAIEVFRRIVELDPTNPLPHLRLAEAFSRIRDVDGAVFEFKTAASQLAGIGRRDDALKVLERLLHHRPDAEQAKIAAELYLSRNQPQDGMQALSKLQVCFQANPRDFDTLSLLARAFNAIGQGAKAIEVQKEMARVARDSGKNDLFREIVERLLRVAPQDEGVRKLASQTGSLATAAPAPTPQSVQAVPPMARQPEPPPPQPPVQSRAQPPQPQAPTRPQPQPPQAVAPARPMPPRMPAQPIPRVEEPEELEDEVSYQEVTDDDEIEEISQADAYERPQSYASDPRVQTGYAQQGYAQQQQQEEYVQDDGAVEYVEENDLGEQLEKLLADAHAFRRVRLFNKALETLRIGLELDPRSMDLHELYRDILIEAGHTEVAVEQMLVIASLFVDALDGESAARALQDVLAFDPNNARAIEMLQELGYEIVDESEEVPTNQAADVYEPAQQERLPSYDVEEMGAADVSPGYSDDRQVCVGRTPSGIPKSRAQEDTHGAGALPSFPLDEPDAGVEYEAREPAVEELEEVDDAAAEDNTAYLPAPEAAPPPPTGIAIQELEDALDEAEFFMSRGLADDARAILAEQLTKHPNHPLLRERIAELDAAEQEQRAESGAREKPREEDRAYDIAASLDALESLEYDGVQPAEGFANADQEVDVEEVFAKFKEGVAKQISVDDSESHYNLGIAYKEMMLIDDAIHEFDVASRDPKRECVCRSMIGMIELERGNLNEAIEAFLQGLAAPIKDPQQETVLCFEIGAAYETKKLIKEALSYYQKAMRRDPNYRDVQERVRRLARNESKAPPRQAAVGADDEFDRAFDDLLSKA